MRAGGGIPNREPDCRAAERERARTLELLLFGTIEIRRDGEAIHGLSAKGRLLLAYLTLRAGQAAASAQIADAVFGESQAGDPHDLVKKTASEIRRFLGEEGYRLVAPAPRMLALDLEGVDVDWIAFRNAIRQGDLVALQHAVALHTRLFLEREPLYWALEEQAACLRLRQHALERLALQALEQGDLESAGAWCAQMLKFELPDVTLQEEVWHVFLEALWRRQEYGKIQHHYRRLQTFLERTAGREPEEATTALYRRIPKSILLRLSQAGQRRAKRVLPDTVRLPHFPAALIGRETAQRELLGIFKNSRLVTVCGIGGVGKTRFAVEVGKEVAADYQDEVGFFDLTACPPESVLATLCIRLNLKEHPGRTPYESLRDLLAPHRLLLLLDNCEHLLDEIAPLASDLVRDCPHLRLLLTSRESLRIDGEQVFALAPLALPPPRAGRRVNVGGAEAADAPALRLFRERAEAVRPGFPWTADNVETVETLCRLVDGLPLGIEIVASQMAGVPLERIVEELSRSALSLPHTRRGVSARHQTLQAALDWSVGMLSVPERTLLRRLSVFVGGWTLEAVEAVCADEDLPAKEISGLLSGLVTKSLVVMEHTNTSAMPFRFLETIRFYAAACLAETGEAAILHQAHAAYYLQILVEVEDLAFVKTYLRLVEQHHANIFSVLQRATTEPELLEKGHRLALYLHSYWAHRGLRIEGRDVHTRLLAAGRERLTPGAQATSLLKIFEYSYGQGTANDSWADACLQEALAIYRGQGDRKGESDIYIALGTRLSYTKNHSAAYANFQRAYDYYRDAPHSATQVYLLIMLGGCASNLYRYKEADATHEKAIELAQNHDIPTMAGLALLFRGFSMRQRGHLDLAEHYFLRSQEIYESIPSAWGVVRSLTALSDLKRRQGRLKEALMDLRATLGWAGEFVDPQENLFIVHAFSELMRDRQDWEACLTLTAGLQHLTALFPDLEDRFGTEMQAAVDTACTHLDQQTADAILREARAACLETLLGYVSVLVGPETAS